MTGLDGSLWEGRRTWQAGSLPRQWQDLGALVTGHEEKAGAGCLSPEMHVFHSKSIRDKHLSQERCAFLT